MRVVAKAQPGPCTPVGGRTSGVPDPRGPVRNGSKNGDAGDVGGTGARVGEGRGEPGFVVAAEPEPVAASGGTDGTARRVPRPLVPRELAAPCELVAVAWVSGVGSEASPIEDVADGDVADESGISGSPASPVASAPGASAPWVTPFRPQGEPAPSRSAACGNSTVSCLSDPGWDGTLAVPAAAASVPSIPAGGEVSGTAAADAPEAGSR